MNEFKGTPGPWANNHYGELKSANGRHVGVWGLGIAHVYRSPEAEANSRIIEAAPELFEAVKACLPFADQDGKVNGVNIVAALRKALGEKP